MSINITNCPRCGADSNKHRLITESCGHCKCRRCFLADEQGCLECKLENEKSAQATTDSLPQAAKDNGNEYKKEDCFKRKSEKTTISLAMHGHIQQIVRTTTTGVAAAAAKPQYMCTICQKVLSSRSSVNYHFGCGNKDYKKYKCERCEQCFSSRSHLNYHLESHALQTYYCDECGKSFTNQIVLKKHQKLHRTGSFKCDECSKMFRCKQYLNEHLERKHRKNLRFQCNICEMKYAVKSTLQQHMLKHLTKKHVCHSCGKKFQRNSTLKLHAKRHTKTDNFACATCFKNFTDAGALRRHVKIHKDAVKYKCMHCDIKTVRKDNMLRHVRNMHSGEDFQNCVEIIKSAAETVKTVACNPSTETDTINHQMDICTEDTRTNQPKTVENSSVIKFIGNVEPVVIPNTLIRTEQSLDTVPNLTKLENVNLDNIETARITHKKLKKKYDPIEMYRKILISEDTEDDSAHNATENDAKVEAHAAEKPIEQQRTTTLNTSKFSEMHWRKNYKYTYQHQEY